MESNPLTEREQRVLEAIVRNFIVTAAPCGSRFLSKNMGISLSPATIRNVMGDLEERGYIDQPHTSAGRVPTDEGYRYYVDRMMERVRLSGKTRNQIKSLISGIDPTDLHSLMDATSKALSLATDQLGVILAPRLANGTFRHVHIYNVDSRRYLLHVAIDSGFVRTMTVEVETELSPWRLQRACGMMNERFFGMSLRQMGEEGDRALSDIEPLELGVIQLFVPSIRKMLQGEADAIHTEGETNIMLKPEFSGREKLGAVVEILGEKKMLMHMFDTQGAQAGKVMVSIGGENRSGMFKSFSVLKTNYQIGNLQGSLGIMGPKRMPYPFLVSAVAYTAKALEQLHR